MGKLELLAPARDAEAGRIAVDYGADALYIGGPSFGARVAAGNNVGDVARLVDYAHRFRVRVYATLNTLVFDSELSEAEKTARELIAAGVDALIVQDMAYMRMGLEGVEMHASTQTFNTTPEKVRFLGESGFSRVILERGLTLDEIKRIRAATDVELECFVHGAICVGFSGRCYMSRSMGPRSGNRGDCMQACRLSYDLIDGSGKPILRNKHLLSVPDLDLSERLEELIDAGVSSFKIEGRLKDNNYVKNVVAHYRLRLDDIIARREGLPRSSSGRTVFDFEPEPARSFTRGGSVWTLDGAHPGMASFDTPKATGAYVGAVTAVSRDSFTLSGEAKLAAGDGICFMADGELRGTNVNRSEGSTVWPNKTDGIVKGAKIYRNFDKSFEDTLVRSRTRRYVDTAARVVLSKGEVALWLTDEDGCAAKASVPNSFDPAADPAKMRETFEKQIGKSGETIFRIIEVTLHTDDNATVPFVPVSTINAMRREAMGNLLRARSMMTPERSVHTEDRSSPYPETRLGPDGNVTNRLAVDFYRGHGVLEIETAYDLRERLSGACVMISAYCIRRETGQCLREKPAYTGELFLVRGGMRYRLVFDCDRCRMEVMAE